MKINKKISILERCAIDYRNKRFSNIGLTGSNYYYVICVCKNPGISQEDLAKRIYVNKSNVARNLKTLQKDGFIYKEINGTDKRINMIFPTNKALNVLPKIKEVISDWNNIILKELDNDTINNIEKILEVLVGNATEYFNKEYIEENN